MNCTVFLLQPGVEFTKHPCQQCRCTDSQDPSTKLNVIKCSPVPCDKNCPKVCLPVVLPEHC